MRSSSTASSRRVVATDMIRSLTAFLALYDGPTRRSLLRAVLLAALIATFDFASLVVLYPVFGALAGGGHQSASVQLGPSALSDLDPNVLLIAAMVLMIARSALGFWARAWWGRRAAKAEVQLSSRVLSSYAYAPYEFHLRSNSSDLLARSVAHVNLATTTALNGLVNLATDATSTFAMTAALFIASPGAAIVVALFLAAIGLAISYFSKHVVRRQTAILTTEVGKVYGASSNVLRGIRELTVANARGAALGTVNEARTRMVMAQRGMLVLAEVPKLVLELALYSAILASLFWVMQGDDPARALPLVALYVVAGLRILPAVARVLTGQTQVRSGMEVGNGIRQELADIDALSSIAAPPRSDLPEYGLLAVEHVSFAYNSHEPVLDACTVRIPFGQTVGLVGPSGSGKTTLLSIMLGLLAPNEGRVTFGHVDVGLADPSWLGRIAYVPQDVYVADDSILSNVALGDDRPDPARALLALKQARLEGVVQRMEDGMETRLHEGGSRLSVGQRQRLGIARALYRNAQVLFLDEPTAALDHGTEAGVLETLAGLRGSVTMVLVAHRLETLAGVDRILRINAGRLQEEPSLKGLLHD